MSYCIKG